MSFCNSSNFHIKPMSNTLRSLDCGSITIEFQEEKEYQCINSIERLLQNNLNGFAKPIQKCEPIEEIICKHSVKTLLKNIPRTSTVDWVSTSVEEYDSLTSCLPWVKDFYYNASQLKNADDITPYYANITTMIYEKKLHECDSFLKFVDTTSISNVLLVGVLRLTNQAKSDLHNWHNLKSKIEVELEYRGLDSKRKLRGL